MKEADIILKVILTRELTFGGGLSDTERFLLDDFLLKKTININ